MGQTGRGVTSALYESSKVVGCSLFTFVLVEPSIIPQAFSPLQLAPPTHSCGLFGWLV